MESIGTALGSVGMAFLFLLWLNQDKLFALAEKWVELSAAGCVP